MLWTEIEMLAFLSIPLRVLTKSISVLLEFSRCFFAWELDLIRDFWIRGSSAIVLRYEGFRQQVHPLIYMRTQTRTINWHTRRLFNNVWSHFQYLKNRLCGFDVINHNWRDILPWCFEGPQGNSHGIKAPSFPCKSERKKNITDGQLFPNNYYFREHTPGCVLPWTLGLFGVNVQSFSFLLFLIIFTTYPITWIDRAGYDDKIHPKARTVIGRLEVLRCV